MSVYKATMNDIANAANMSRRTLYIALKAKKKYTNMLSRIM